MTEETQTDPTLYTAYLDDSLTLTKMGDWLHEGEKIQNKNICNLFTRSIQWNEEEQRFCLKIGKGQAFFHVEDTAYFVKELHEQDCPWLLVLADGRQEAFDPATLSIGDQHQMYCRTLGGHRARFSRSALQFLLSRINEQGELEVCGTRYPLSKGSPSDF